MGGWGESRALPVEEVRRRRKAERAEELAACVAEVLADPSNVQALDSMSRALYEYRVAGA